MLRKIGYLESLLRLKQKYNGYVHIGLEAEYFPSYDQSGYYRKLSQDPRIECMLLGQHMAEAGEDEYSFSWSDEKLNAKNTRHWAMLLYAGSTAVISMPLPIRTGSSGAAVHGRKTCQI